MNPLNKIPETYHNIAGARPVPAYQHSHRHQRALDEVAVLDTDYAPRPLDIYKRQGSRKIF
jgi:hypothetical protein